MNKIKLLGNNRNQTKLWAFFISLARNHYPKVEIVKEGQKKFSFSFSYSEVSVQCIFEYGFNFIKTFSDFFE